MSAAMDSERPWVLLCTWTHQKRSSTPRTSNRRRWESEEGEQLTRAHPK